MKTYEFGLHNCEDRPQAYKLSAILAGYYLGFRKQGFVLTSVSCRDMDVKSDGTLDFSVPKRHKPYPRLCNLWRNAKLAWLVLSGRASVLYYE